VADVAEERAGFCYHEVLCSTCAALFLGICDIHYDYICLRSTFSHHISFPGSLFDSLDGTRTRFVQFDLLLTDRPSYVALITLFGENSLYVENDTLFISQNLSLEKKIIQNIVQVKHFIIIILPFLHFPGIDGYTFIPEQLQQEQLQQERPVILSHVPG
jgi:hypothetical protein